MPILDAALAFSLTMLLVALVVTGVVTVIHQITNLRGKHLQKMLTEYIDKEVQPVVKRELSRLTKSIGNDPAITKLEEQASSFTQSDVFKNGELAKLIDVSTENIQERLKRSALGNELLAQLGDEAQSVFDELGQHYEAVGKRFTESFRDNARWWATTVAIVLALILNIDSIEIARSYVMDGRMRNRAIAQMDTIMAKYDSELKSSSDNVKTTEALKMAVNKSREQIDFLSGAGFPIGLAYFPHAGYNNLEAADFKRRNNLGGWILWVLGIALTGYFAGRGAPFWYDAVSGISRMAQQSGKKPDSG